jgi:hypothetical protein
MKKNKKLILFWNFFMISIQIKIIMENLSVRSFVPIVSLLPKEVLNLILEFQGYHKCRNGKYMTQICGNDEKYEALRKKTWKKCYYINHYGRFYRTVFYKRIDSTTCKIIIHCIDYGDKIHWYMSFLHFLGIEDQQLVWKKCQNKSIHYVYPN